MLHSGAFVRAVRVVTSEKYTSNPKSKIRQQAKPFAVAPAEVPPRPTTLRHVIYYDIRELLVWQYKRTRMVFAVTLGLGACAAAYVWQQQGPESGKTNTLRALERGVVGGYWLTDASATVERASLHDQLVELLRPQNTRQYAIVMGAPGTGKSTAIRKAARESSSSVNGVVYYLVQYPDNLSTGLAALLGCRKSTLAKEEPRATWLQLEPQLLEGAAAFMLAHGRPATLVLDGVDVIAKEDPTFLDMLQNFARNAADAGVLRVVFVSSDGAASARLESRSEWSRAADPLEVGDISDVQAVDFLVKSNETKPDVAGVSAR